MIRKIPNDTKSFHFYNANPKNLRTGDCVIRAISLATACSWEATYQNLFDIAMQTKRLANEVETFNEYLKRIEDRFCFIFHFVFILLLFVGLGFGVFAFPSQRLYYSKFPVVLSTGFGRFLLNNLNTFWRAFLLDRSIVQGNPKVYLNIENQATTRNWHKERENMSFWRKERHRKTRSQCSLRIIIRQYPML